MERAWSLIEPLLFFFFFFLVFFFFFGFFFLFFSRAELLTVGPFHTVFEVCVIQGWALGASGVLPSAFLNLAVTITKKIKKKKKKKTISKSGKKAA